MEPETIDDALELIVKQPDDAQLFQNLGSLYLKAGRLTKAREAYDRSLALDPLDPWTHLYMGNSFFFNGKYQIALSWFQRAAELLPGEAIVYTCQGDVYKGMGRFDLAEKAYRQGACVAPDDSLARRKLAEWYEFRYGEDSE